MKRYSCGHSFLLGVDKPLGLSSHDVVARVRRAVGESKVGHAGTLDPLASGVLIIGAGQATRLLGLITLDDKRYVARISFGAETATDDAEGEVIRTAAVPRQLGDAAFARAALAGIVGDQMQVPPAYSAVSVDGRRAYAVARGGGEVELDARPITVHAAELVSIESEDSSIVWTCAFHVSKGTYIRSLARDLARSLGTAGHLAGLIRTSSGCVGLSQCASLDELAEGGLELALAKALNPVALLPYPALEAPEEVLGDIMDGKHLRASRIQDMPGEGSACLTRDGRLLSIVSLDGGRISVQSNFPNGIEGVVA